VKLENKTAIITGAGRGIGRAIALTLAADGANIVAADVERLHSTSSQYQDSVLKGYQAALRLVDEIKSKGHRAIAINADVTKSTEVERMVGEAVREFGNVDILVNNAGVVTRADVVDLSEDQWDLVMNVNVKGVFLCCKFVAPHMIRNRSGRIVNISSESGKTGERGLAHYCASKFAVIGFTQSLALELAPYNINVNAVCPGMVYTKMWDYLTKVEDAKTPSEEKFDQLVEQLMPLGRPQTPEDIANAVLFLCTSNNITGESLNVTGGHEMH
jgi:meso-butanediol dehydrogenase/(S,S)-butanediol dehydrogenase/diacetyl reductase